MNVIASERYLQKLIDCKENGMIKVITGIKRCSKNYLLLRLYYDYLLAIGVKKENIIAIALDEEENDIYREPKELSAYIRSKIVNNDENYYVLSTNCNTPSRKKSLKAINLCLYTAY